MTETSAVSRPATRGWLPVAIFALAVIVASFGSWNVSIWTDEAVTINAASRSWSDLWALLQNIDAVHSLYYAVMKLWIGAFGIGEFMLRLPSALAFGGVALGVYVLGRRLVTPGTAVTAAAVALAMPRLFWAGIEARPFVFSALLAVWTCVALLDATRARTRPWRWVLYAALAALGVATNIYLVFIVIGHGVSILLRHRTDRAVWFGYLAAAAATAVVSMPILLLVRSQQGQLGTGGDRSPLSIARKILVNQLFLGETPSEDATAAWFGLAWQIAAVAAAVIGLALMILAIVRSPRVGDGKSDVLAIALPWLVLPTAVIATYAVAIAPIYQPRYFTFTAPAAALLIALGLRSLRSRALTAAVIIAGLACVSVVYVSQRTVYAKSGTDWVHAAQVVSEQAEPGDAVLFVQRYPYPGEYSEVTARRIAQAYPEAFVGLRDLTLHETGAETATLDGRSVKLASIEQDLSDHPRVWMLYGHHYPADVVTADRRVMERAGFTPETRWDGPHSVVIEWTKTAP